MDTAETQYRIQIRRAIVYCLAYERREAGLDPVQLSQMAESYERPSSRPEDLTGQILYYADLVVDDPLRDEHESDPTQHPLANIDWQVALVYGGATKIKGYVFESARLPEVRGASALLDRINVVDVRALWGQPFRDDQEKARAEQVQADYQCLEAPECIVYAGGGNFLAFAPVGKAQKMADQVEHLYTRETLVANSAAVAHTFSLLELVYGRQPEKYWLADWQKQWEQADTRPLLESYYGDISDEPFKHKKRFPELVTVLASRMMHRRGGWGDGNGRQRRYIPHYELLPYAIKCHSCDVRPAVVRDQAADKEYCEPCARKRVSGQVAKKEKGQALNWFYDPFAWRPTGVISWEAEFNQFLDDPKRNKLKGHYYQGLLKETRDHLNRINRLSNKEQQTIKAWDDEDLFGFLGYIQNHPPPEYELPLLVAANDLGEIGQASSPQRYVGLIYADGNDVGARIAGISSAAGYIQFSRDLESAAREAVFEALAEHLSPVWIEEAVDPERPDRRQMWVHPWEIITIGGDDLIVIVPGDKALDVALSIGQKFEERLGDTQKTTQVYADQRYRPHCLKPEEDERVLQVEPVTKELGYEPTVSLSAGLVVAHATTPIFFLWELAEQLIKSAKGWRKKMNREREKAGHPLYKGGTVDFMALKSVGMVASRLKAFRQRAYRREDRWLTARPYTWVELEGLLEAAQAIYESGLGRSQVYRLQEFLMQGQQSAAINYLYAFSRLRPEERQALACAFNLAWHGEGDVPPWRQRPDGKLETIWRDLVEIYDFVKEGQDG